MAGFNKVHFGLCVDFSRKSGYAKSPFPILITWIDKIVALVSFVIGTKSIFIIIFGKDLIHYDCFVVVTLTRYIIRV